ncbi:2Fe-2S iron-sulfur cluster-binding protein [Kaarinaea lacus]
MSYSVTLMPNGKKFQCEANESILEAALRSGLNLSYHCATGSCGECRARVVEGQVKDHRYFDFVIPEAEKLTNTVLLCSVTPSSDVVIEANEAASAKDIPMQNISVKVAKLDRINANNLVLHLRTPRSRTLRFLAGQYIQAKTATTDPENFYVASCPCNGMIIQLHLQRTENAFSEFAFNHLKVGDALELNGPFGEFTLDEESRRPIVMVAQDTGFAPLKSLIEHAIALDLPQSMYLFWLVEQGRDHYQANYCRSWEDALDCFIYRPLHLDKLANEENDFHSAADYVLGRAPIESEIDLYLSGSSAMIEDFRKAFIQKGTPDSRIHIAKPA